MQKVAPGEFCDSCLIRLVRPLKRNFPSAQKALVGYDVLFPKYVSNALQIINVQTTGIQERLALTRLKNFGVSVDKYLVWGDRALIGLR